MSEVDGIDIGEAKKRAIKTVTQLHNSHLQDLVAYMTALEMNELHRCAQALDDVQLRRAQGAVKVYREILELLNYEPVAERRAVQRQEV